MNSPQSEIWAITSFFNPAGYRRRLVNYRQFHDALQIPLATIELSFNNNWELAEHDADILVRISDGDVMWQKERLLNQLITQLPRGCKYVAWIDSDVLFQDPDWPQQAIETLPNVPLVQLFSTLRYLNEDQDDLTSTQCFPAVAAAVREGRPPSDLIGPLTDGYPNMGMAWAARRELLEKHGFYDGCVTGGGDTALVSAAYGLPEDIMRRHHSMNSYQHQRYRLWADGLYSEINGNIGVLPGEIRHLWHGDLSDRRYGSRHSDISPHNFDPNTDLRLGRDGAWRWATEKPALHAQIRRYFHGRNEDGIHESVTG